MHNYVMNERGNIPITLPLQEFKIKTLIFDIIIKQGRSSFNLDAENIHFEDACRISRWAQEYGCETIATDNNTLLVKQVVPTDMVPKKCPFCGEYVEFQVFDGYDDYAVYTIEEIFDGIDDKNTVIPKCSKCSCSLGSFNSVREALQAWNERI